MEIIELRKTTDVEIDQLEFDADNPRLFLELADFDEDERPTTEQIIDFLHGEADLDELIMSILANGYIKIEPLIVILDNQKYKVLEGNRRLAAVRLLQSKPLRKACGFRVDDAALTKDILDSIKKIPVYRVENAKDANALIGFKHIKGPYKWNSFAKAKFVTRQYREGLTIEKISRAIGDKNSTVRNLVAGTLVLDQAINADLFEITDRSKPGMFGVSHLYTALGRSEYQDFLGLEKGWSKTPELEPISPDKLDNLAETLAYIYGSKKDKKSSLIRSQNPDLKNLGRVLAEDEGLRELRAGATLSVALDMIRPDQEVFDEAIRKAYQAKNQALANVTRYDGKDERTSEIAAKVAKGAAMLRHTVEIEREGYLKTLSETSAE